MGKSGEACEPSNKAMLFRMSGYIGQKSAFVVSFGIQIFNRDILEFSSRDCGMPRKLWYLADIQTHDLPDTT
jgi:hypothetical protein